MSRETYSVCCKLYVSDNHNTDNNPEFYQMWNKIQAEYADANIVGVLFDKVAYGSNRHRHDNVICVFIQYICFGGYKSEIEHRIIFGIDDLTLYDRLKARINMHIDDCIVHNNGTIKCIDVL